MKSVFAGFVMMMVSAFAGALTFNYPSLSDAAYYVPYDQQGGSITNELVTGNNGLLISCHNSTSDKYVGAHPAGMGLGDQIDGFDSGKFGNCYNGSGGWTDINMVDDAAIPVQSFAMSFWFRRDPVSTATFRDCAMAHLWEVRDGWDTDETQLDIENNPNNTNINYPHLEMKYSDGANWIKIGYNGGGGWQYFTVGNVFEDGQWHNVIINYQGYYNPNRTDIDLYIDGTRITNGDPGIVANGWGALPVEAFGFGSHSAKAGDGAVWDDFDELAIWKRKLTQAEINWIAGGTDPIGVQSPTMLGGGYPAGDFDQNGFVNDVDLYAMAEAWLNLCDVVECGQTNLYADEIFNLANAAGFAGNWLSDANTGPVMAIEMHNGAPTFKVDGAFTTAAVFSHNMPELVNPVKGFADIGTIIQDFGGMDLDQKWMELDPFRSNYVNLEWRFNLLLRNPYLGAENGDPDALTMPWITLNAPQWWATDASNTNELEVYQNASGGSSTTFPDGKKYASLASAKWRQDTTEALEHMLDYLYVGGRMNSIAGFKISDVGCGAENLWRYAHDASVIPGYGIRTVEAFRDWLRDKYNNNITSLRASWNNSGVTFDTAQVPPRSERIKYSGSRTFRDPAMEMDVIDFEQFWNELIVETMDYFAGVIKRKTNDSKLVGGFYCYFYEWCGNPEDGHQALGKYNDSQNLDFIWQTSSYSNRVYQTGADNQRGPAYSSQLHGKQWMHSNDTATYLAQDYFKTTGASAYAYTDTIEKNKRMFLRSAGFNICNNGIMQEFFTLWDGWYNDAVLMTEVGKVNAIYINSNNHNRSSNAEVLIVSDELSCSYTPYSPGDSPFLSHTLRDPQIALNQMGTPADHILVDDIALLPNPAQYKLVVFMNCWHLTNAQRTLIDSLKGNDRVLMFCYAPGYFNGNSASESAMESLMGGMNMVVDSETLRRALMYATTNHPLGTAIRNAGVTGSFGISSNVCKRIYADVPSSQRIAYDPDSSSHETMAIKDNGAWEALYAVTSDLPAAVYREIARYAGVHIYNESNDTFYANSSYICLHANGTGQRMIRFPRPVTLYDAETEGTALATNTNSFTYYFSSGETRLLRYE